MIIVDYNLRKHVEIIFKKLFNGHSINSLVLDTRIYKNFKNQRIDPNNKSSEVKIKSERKCK